MPLTDLTTNTTQPQAPTHAGNPPVRPPANWQSPVFAAPGPRAAAPNRTADRIPGIVLSHRPRWTPEKHARILAKIKASRTDVMPPLPEAVEEALDPTRPAAVGSGLTETIGHLAESTKSCFYSLTEGALELLQQTLPTATGGSWPLPGAAAAAQPAGQGDALQSRVADTDPTCAVKPADTAGAARSKHDLNQLTSAWGKDFDIRVSPSFASRADTSLTDVLIVIGDGNHYDAGMSQLIDAVLGAMSEENDLLLAESRSDQTPMPIMRRGFPPERCIGIDDPVFVGESDISTQCFFDATKAVINLMRNEIPTAQQDRLMPFLKPAASYMEAAERLDGALELLKKGRVIVPPKRAPDIKRQFDLARKCKDAFIALLENPKRYKARDEYMVAQMVKAVDTGRLAGRKGFAVIGQGHLSNIRDNLLKRLPCIVLEQKKFKNLPPVTWQPGGRITY